MKPRRISCSEKRARASKVEFCFIDHSAKGGIAPRIVSFRKETNNIYGTVSGKSDGKELHGTYKYTIEPNL
jgi:hypothetical protein